MALDLFFFSGFSLYPSLSLSLSTLHIALPQEVQEVCEVGGSGGGGGGGGGEERRGHLERSLNVARSLVRNL